MKFVLIAVIGVSCFTSLIIFQLFFADSLDIINKGDNDNKNGSPKQKVENISLIIDFDGEKTNINKANFSLDNLETTVFDAVDKWCDVEYEVYPNGDYYITHIEGVGEGWIYHHNGDYPGDAVNRRYLDNGDLVEFTYVGT